LHTMEATLMSSMQASMQASMQSMQATAAISAASSAASLAASSAATSAASCAQTMTMRMNMDMFKEITDMKKQNYDDESSESSCDAPATSKLEKTGVWAEPAAKVEPEVAYSWLARQVPEPSPQRTDDRTSQVSYSEYETSDSEPDSYGASEYGEEEPETHVPHAKAYTAPVVTAPLLPHKSQERSMAPPKLALPKMAPPKMAPPKMAPPPQRASLGSQSMQKDMMPPAIKPRPDRSKPRSRPRAPSPVSEVGETQQPGAVSKSIPRKKHRNDTPCIPPTARHSKGTGGQRSCVHSIGQIVIGTTLPMTLRR
jgi:hypothetical protein